MAGREEEEDLEDVVVEEGEEGEEDEDYEKVRRSKSNNLKIRKILKTIKQASPASKKEERSGGEEEEEESEEHLVAQYGPPDGVVRLSSQHQKQLLDSRIPEPSTMFIFLRPYDSMKQAYRTTKMNMFGSVVELEYFDKNFKKQLEHLVAKETKGSDSAEKSPEFYQLMAVFGLIMSKFAKAYSNNQINKSLIYDLGKYKKAEPAVSSEVNQSGKHSLHEEYSAFRKTSDLTSEEKAMDELNYVVLREVGSVLSLLFSYSEDAFNSILASPYIAGEDEISRFKKCWLYFDYGKSFFKKGTLFAKLRNYFGAFRCFRKASRFMQKGASLLHGSPNDQLNSTDHLSMFKENSVSLQLSVASSSIDKIQLKRPEKGWYGLLTKIYNTWAKCIDRMAYLCPSDSNLMNIMEDFTRSWKTHSMRFIIEGVSNEHMTKSDEERIAQQWFLPLKALCLMENRYVREIDAEEAISEITVYQGSILGREAAKCLSMLDAIRVTLNIENSLSPHLHDLVACLDIPEELKQENTEILRNIVERKIPFVFSCQFLPYMKLFDDEGGILPEVQKWFHEDDPRALFGELFEILRCWDDGDDAIVYVTERRATETSPPAPVAIKIIKEFSQRRVLGLSEMYLIKSYHDITKEKEKQKLINQELQEGNEEDNSDSDDKKIQLDKVDTDEDVYDPSFARFYGAFLFNDDMWIVMEYGGGGSLLDYLSAAYLSEREVAYLCKAILIILKNLHQRNQACRDLNAVNILLARDGEVFYGDMGMSSALMRYGSVYYRRIYMAPELLLPQTYPITPAIDVWSLGCLVIEMITGNPPAISTHYDPFESWFYLATQVKGPKLPRNIVRGEKRLKFSTELKQFAKLCFVPDPKLRPSADTLLKHPFVKQTISKAKFAKIFNRKHPQNLLSMSMF